MAKGKDPAFLFYPKEFLAECFGLTETEIGTFLICLIEQFDYGHLNYDLLKDISHNNQKILCKFVKDVDGLFFNRWLQQKIDDRKRFSESRRKNRLGKKKKCKDLITSDNIMEHMENENENKDLNINKNRKKKASGKKKKSVKIVQECCYHAFDHLSIVVTKVMELRRDYTQEQIDSTLDDISNYVKNKNYKNLYLTAKKWLEKKPKRQDTEQKRKEIEELCRISKIEEEKLAIERKIKEEQRIKAEKKSREAKIIKILEKAGDEEKLLEYKKMCAQSNS